jgi:hypothetical protein
VQGDDDDDANSVARAATLQLLVFFFFAVLCLHPSDYLPSPLPAGFPDASWPKFFRMPVLMLMLITLLNDIALISIGYDNVVYVLSHFITFFPGPPIAPPHRFCIGGGRGRP